MQRFFVTLILPRECDTTDSVYKLDHHHIMLHEGVIALGSISQQLHSLEWPFLD